MRRAFGLVVTGFCIALAYVAMGSVFLGWVAMLRVCYHLAGWAGVAGGVFATPVTVGIGPWVVAFAYGYWEPVLFVFVAPPLLFGASMGLGALAKEPSVQ